MVVNTRIKHVGVLFVSLLIEQIITNYKFVCAIEKVEHFFWITEAKEIHAIKKMALN